MTPKEKAQELIKKFTFASIYFADKEDGARKNAKQCAVISVNEILNNNCGSTTDSGVNAENSKLYMDEYYWMEVEHELNKSE